MQLAMTTLDWLASLGVAFVLGLMWGIMLDVYLLSRRRDRRIQLPCGEG